MALLSALITGLALGSLYGLIALGFHVTYAVSGTLNFAQGTSAMLGAVLTFALGRTLGWPMGIAIVCALAACAAYGLLVERLAVRPFVKRGSEAWLMATVALGLVTDNLVLFGFGAEPRSLPSPLATTPIAFGPVGLGIYPLHLLAPAVCLSLAAALYLFSRRTLWGTAALATAQNREAAQLMGIPVGRVAAWAFALSSLLAGVAGVMVAPLFNIQSDMGTLIGLKAFAVAIIGGLRNAWGIVAAGLLFGASESLITAAIGSAGAQLITFSLVILALALRPQGLLGGAEVRKV
jgi:branched-chain amino acid transport system permease protein